uniref:uncharacterized protein LOC117602549 isoform X1 n=2 Tax=Osmia lignaria TaxID=473952 RepID=UPI0014795230|nr:uncharacterized protein LOC117602549 isoform X1 [Osmia lignaria]
MEIKQKGTKKVEKVPKRISATHNFVYEFNPLANSTSTSNNAIKRRGSQYVSNIGGGDSPIRSTSNKPNFNLQESLTAALPKLNPQSDVIMDNLGKQKIMANYNKNTNLPRIKRLDADQQLVKDRGKPSPVSEIDREVEKVKSDWQTMRTNSEWMQSKHLANARTRKLYDTLEKMTREIDKIQTSYLDPASNQYLQRGAMKTLHTPCVSFEEKAVEIKDVLFPKENKKTNETNTVPSTVSQKEMYEMKQTKKCMNKEFENRSLLPGMQTQNYKSGSKLSSSNFNKSNIHTNGKKNLKKMGSDIRQYLENYISDAEKNFMNKEESNIKEFNTSPGEVEEMLKKLNIQSFDMYDIDDCNEDKGGSPLQSIERKKNIGTSARTTEKTAARNSSPKEGDYLTRHNNAFNTDTSIQTNTKFNRKNNSFIEMGLSTLNTNLPHDALSRILQSEYLKKDISLKPM